MSRFLVLAVVVLASCVVIEAQFGGFNIRPGFGSPLIPSLDDNRMCRENANGRKYQLTYKMPTQTCQPYCKYDNETEQITAIDGQFCCDFVGIGPTGNISSSETCAYTGPTDEDNAGGFGPRCITGPPA
ncbi:hypothetical protein AVEN_259344-1 [Araneus ventricosus]|uniref:Uncharacterized protein n=1 Tax=Araneus ventricosus TaxID=182803 RepID=A0A4Y2VWH6_ARAVE|nr:hypothetical protein AVEN_259344-1 [Araneus ventricosus]